MKQERNLSRNKSGQSPKQFIIKRNLKNKLSQPASQISSLNTSLQSITQQLSPFPEEGKLLNLIHNLENKEDSFNIEDVEQKLAISDNPSNCQLSRQLSYNKHYHYEYQNTLQNESVLLGNSLLKQKITQQLRAKMVDWMIEVLCNYQDTTSDATFFRCVSIMDYFLSKSSICYQDSNLHLIGIASMYIATKLEDIYHIPLEDFVKRVGHSKYSHQKIKSMEQTILDQLQFEVSFPTSLDHLQNIYYQCFSLNDDQKLQNIFDASAFILKMCLHDYAILMYNTNVLASAALYYSIIDFINSDTQIYKKSIIQQYCDKIIQISKVEEKQFHDCFHKLNVLIDKFKEKYPDLINLDKFA